MFYFTCNHGLTLRTNFDESNPGAVLDHKLWGYCPVSPFVTASILSVLRNRKKYKLHIPTFEITRAKLNTKWTHVRVEQN